MEDNITIRRQKDDVLRNLNIHRRLNYLCDVVVVAGGREFPAHRSVLAAGNSFFKGLFDAHVKGKELYENKVQLKQVDPNIVDDILGYIYTGEIKISNENAQAIAMAADFLLLENLKDEIDSFMAEMVEECEPKDLMSFYKFSRQYNHEALGEEVLKLMKKDFEAFISRPEKEFLELSLEKFQELISDNDLEVSNEEVVFRAAVEWAKHKKGRKKDFPKLFSLVRLCSLSEEFLKSSVAKETLVTGSKECVKCLQKHMSTPYNGTMLNIQHPRESLDPYIDAIFICALEHEEAYSKRQGPTWYYIPSKETWNYEVIDFAPPFHFTMNSMYYNGSIFSLRENQDEVILDQYDMQGSKWSNITAFKADMPSGYSSTCMGSNIYVVGGKRSNMTVADVLMCDVSDLSTPCSFKTIASLNTARQEALVVNDGNNIYVIGGMEGPNSYIQTAERYNPITDSWEFVAPMKTKRIASKARCVAFNDKIYVIQAQDDMCDCLDKFDLVYDIKSKKWAKISQAPREDSMNCISLQVLAGYDDMLNALFVPCYETYGQSHRGSEVEMMGYDIEEDDWITGNPKIFIDAERKELVPRPEGFQDGDWCKQCLTGFLVRVQRRVLTKME